MLQALKTKKKGNLCSIVEQFKNLIYVQYRQIEPVELKLPEQFDVVLKALLQSVADLRFFIYKQTCFIIVKGFFSSANLTKYVGDRLSLTKAENIQPCTIEICSKNMTGVL